MGFGRRVRKVLVQKMYKKIGKLQHLSYPLDSAFSKLFKNCMGNVSKDAGLLEGCFNFYYPLDRSRDVTYLKIAEPKTLEEQNKEAQAIKAVNTKNTKKMKAMRRRFK